MAYAISGGISGNYPGTLKPPTPTPTGNYNAAVTTQAGDYDSIMKGYKDLYENPNGSPGGGSSFGSSGLNFNPTSPVFNTYKQGAAYTTTPGMSGLMGNLSEFAKSGGYSTNDISSMRARAVSPIRSAYSSANREVGRQRGLQGGYSPNMGAVLAKLAREQSGQMSEASTNINAALAEMIANGKMQAMSQLSPLVSQENSLFNQYKQSETAAARGINERNTAEANRVNAANEDMRMKIAEYNRSLNQQTSGTKMAALQGQQSLYGTTPALTNTFGQQALAQGGQNLQAQSISNANNANRANTGLSLAGSVRAAAPQVQTQQARTYQPYVRPQQTNPGLSIPIPKTPTNVAGLRW